MSDQPNLVQINMLDTDYAKMVSGEPISPERQGRIEAADAYTFSRLEKQISRYLYGQLGQESKDDILCSIGQTAELLTQLDMENIHQRMRDSGRFYLMPGEREQIINWVKDELAIDLGKQN
ncbi:MAG: hypothetical protein HC800_19760 [Phormidesmis sp. RL_2_1]|nr:hypothetical protein [Phormidesmis sp. RL_2_1]